MNPTTELTLLYGKKPIRALLGDKDGLWFAASDLYASHRLWTDRRCLSRIAPDHLRLLTFPSEAGPIRLTAVSPLGGLTVAKWLPPKLDRIMDSWIRRETNRLAAEYGFAPLGMELLADGTLPTKPKAVHDLYLPWNELRLRCGFARRRPANPDEPALADEDPNASPHDHSAQTASIARLMAAGEAALAREAAAHP